MKYDITSNTLLSAAAKALSPDELEAQALIAELALGVRDTSYTDADAIDAANGIAIQVNLQLERGVEAEAYESYSQGARSFTPRDFPFSKTALAIFAALRGPGRFESFHSRLAG